jgi:hypothetical protein
MFRVPDLRNKIVFKIAIIAVYALRTLPVLRQFQAIQDLQNQANNGGVVSSSTSSVAITHVAIFRDHAAHHGVDHAVAQVIPKLEQGSRKARPGRRRSRSDVVTIALPDPVDRLRVRAAPVRVVCSGSPGSRAPT